MKTLRPNSLLHGLPKLILVSITFCLLAACAGVSAETLADTPTPGMNADGSIPIRLVLENPDRFLGSEIVVVGWLRSEGSGLDARFYVEDGADRIAVTAWAPPERMHVPGGKPGPATMRDFLDKHLRITGLLQNESGQLRLQVLRTEELD